KYNRLWSQITACSSLLIQIIAGYVFAMMAIQVLQPPTLVYSLLFVASIIIFLSLIITRLESERIKTRRLLANMLKR
ncbi:MAG TPA: hypothetical protein VJI46_03615, partial [Candidatus Nanoarchaeia archaeon]|nr:hypothetical protein [Candidatus Nanoarchaeia archaeon]